MAAFRKAAIQDRVTANIVTYASDCQQVVSLIRLNEVDAAIGYDVFQRQSPDGMDTVPLPEADAVAIPAAAVAFSRQPEKARRFVAFISGPRGKEIFAEYGYSLSPQ
jgi:molybdate transport system substrate-binding protein